jgi:hypothetical protein
MTNDKYIYSHETKSLKQWIEKPDENNYYEYNPEPSEAVIGFDLYNYKQACEDYESKVARLPTIQAEGLNLDKDCELVEGKDFVLQYQYLSIKEMNSVWLDCDETFYYTRKPHLRRLFALPIHSVDTPSQQQISKDDLEDFKILEEYDMKDRLAGAIRHALTKVPESNRENFIVNLCNGMIGSAILHYRNKYEKKLDVKSFKEQFK